MRRSPLATIMLLFCLLAAAPPAARAAYPGRPGLIVFSLTFHDYVSKTGGLYALSGPYSKPRPLTVDPEDSEPSFAPSGKKLVFVRWFEPFPGAPRTASLYTLDLRSRQTRRLTDSHVDTNPAFGRNGTIAFSRHDPATGSNDILLRTAKGHLRRLTSGRPDDLSPVFTPGGRRILFVRMRRGAWPTTTVYSIGIDGKGLQALGTQELGEYLDVSPDGRHFVLNAIRRLRDGKIAAGIWTEPLTGGSLRLLAPVGEFPAYSPDGRKIVYWNRKGLWLRPSGKRGPPTQIFEAHFHFNEEGRAIRATTPAWQPLP